MTDKEQIIIDGVDITGCMWCDFEPNAEPYCRINIGDDLNCKDNPNCYFKKLARKTQELNVICKTFNIMYSYDEETGKMFGRCDDLYKKTQECEELKKYIKEDLAPHAQVLQKENDNLKEKFKKFFGIDNQECWNIAFLKDENARYRKALEEIEEYVKDLKRDICNNCGWHNTDNCNPVGNVCETLGTILDIIRKAKGEE